MHLTSRALRLDDFEAFFHNCFYRVRHEDELRGAVAHEWRVLLEEAVTLSCVIEAEGRAPEERLVGCAQAVFVTEQFARFLWAAEIPCATRAAVRRMPDGSWPLLNKEQVRQAQAAGDGVPVLITRWNCADALLCLEDQMRVQDSMNRAFAKLSRGYRYREMLMPATGQKALARSLAAGFRLRRDYADYYRCNPPAPLPQEHPYLMGITREEAFADEGSLINAMCKFLFWGCCV